MATPRTDRIHEIQRLSSQERRWQPAPAQFLDLTAQDTRFRALGVAVELQGCLYVWVLLERQGEPARYQELARAPVGDARYEDALAHGLQTLSVITGQCVPTALGGEIRHADGRQGRASRQS